MALVFVDEGTVFEPAIYKGESRKKEKEKTDASVQYNTILPEDRYTPGRHGCSGDLLPGVGEREERMRKENSAGSRKCVTTYTKQIA